MPYKIDEKFESIKSIQDEEKLHLAMKKGYKPKPPKGWFDKIYPIIAKQYPDFSKERIAMIVAGIWHKYPLYKKLTLLKRFM